MAIIEVAIPVPLAKTFDYLSDHRLNAGVRVKVPFGRKKVIGIVLGSKDKSEFEKLKSVEEIIDESPILDKPILDFLFWSANYYHHPIGEVISAALPKNLRLGKDAKIKKVYGLPDQTQAPEFDTTDEQKIAIEKVLKSAGNYQGFLLHGVTGSGKTEVYLNITQAMLDQDKQVLVLVPEIGLTPQMIARFESRLETCRCHSLSTQ